MAFTRTDVLTTAERSLAAAAWSLAAVLSRFGRVGRGATAGRETV